MREIKFRAWDKEKKQMVIWGDDDFYYLAKDYDGSVNLIGCHNGGGDPDSSITDYELMQYTGLKDKNGKEIYEGDIVRLTTKTGGDIDRLCEWSYRNNGWRFQGFNYAGDDQRIIEVIGNIYENPELLK